MTKALKKSETIRFRSKKTNPKITKNVNLY